jgi:hypothetical protein
MSTSFMGFDVAVKAPEVTAVTVRVEYTGTADEAGIIAASVTVVKALA